MTSEASGQLDLGIGFLGEKNKMTNPRNLESYVFLYIYIFTYIEPKWPIFLKIWTIKWKVRWVLGIYSHTYFFVDYTVECNSFQTSKWSAANEDVKITYNNQPSNTNTTFKQKQQSTKRSKVGSSPNYRTPKKSPKLRSKAFQPQLPNQQKKQRVTADCLVATRFSACFPFSACGVFHSNLFWCLPWRFL